MLWLVKVVLGLVVSLFVAAYLVWPIVFNFIMRSQELYDAMMERMVFTVVAAVVSVYISWQGFMLYGLALAVPEFLLIVGMFFFKLLTDFDTEVVPGLDDDDNHSLSGKVALVTGGNSGIGYHTAKRLLQMGATVVIASRNEKKGVAAVEEMSKEVKSGAAHFIELDLGDHDAVVRFVQDFPFPKVNIMVLNSGFFPVPKRHVDGEIEPGFAAMHLGHFLLFTHMLPLLRAAELEGQVRVHITASYGHSLALKETYENDADLRKGSRGRRTGFELYARAKMANMLMSNELNRRAAESGSNLLATCSHPGGVYTDIWYWPRIGNNFMPKVQDAIFHFFAKRIMRTPAAGARTLIYCAASPECTIGGEYYVDCKVTPKLNDGGNMEVSANLWKLSVELLEEYMAPEFLADPIMAVA